VVCVKAALAAVATIGETTRLHMRAHLDDLVSLAPVLGRRAATVEAGAGGEALGSSRRHVG
jgi:hypothetical protein